MSESYSICSASETCPCSYRAEVTLICFFDVFARIERKSRPDQESNLPLCREEVEKHDLLSLLQKNFPAS